MSDLVTRLRSVIGSDISVCGEAADEIERLHKECHKLASLLMSEYTWIHESMVSEVDLALIPYLGTSDDATTESSSTP